MTMQRIDDLAVKVCRVIRDVRKDHQSWIRIERVHDALVLENLLSVDAALAFAKAKGWVAISGTPAHSVLLQLDAP